MLGLLVATWWSTCGYGMMLVAVDVVLIARNDARGYGIVLVHVTVYKYKLVLVFRHLPITLIYVMCGLIITF